MPTRIANTTAAGVTIRGKDLVDDIIGERTYTEMLYFLVVERFPDATEARILDACLVTLMEHGWTPSSIVTRFMIDSVPEEVQVAIASGLPAVGSVFAGTSEACAGLLQAAMASSADQAAHFAQVVADHRGRKAAIPGFGHPTHKPDDPRSQKLLSLAQTLRPESGPVLALLALSAAIDANFGKHITINATGAIAALLLEIGFPPEIMRGVAVVSRAGGLMGHIIEERRTHAARDIWKQTEEDHPYAA